MTSASIYKMIELIILFGAVVGFCAWQLRTVAKLRRDTNDRQQQSDEPARHLER
jgi:hypothetical protein